MLPVLCVEPTTYPLTLVNVRVCQFIFSNTLHFTVWRFTFELHALCSSISPWQYKHNHCVL